MRRMTNGARALAQPSSALFNALEWAAVRVALALSPRESDIVLGLLDGEVESHIAERLAISVHTVHCHVGRLYRKLGVQSRSDLLIAIFRTYLEITRHVDVAWAGVTRSGDSRSRDSRSSDN